MRQIADALQVSRLVEQMAGQVAGAMACCGLGEKWALVGIRDRGDVLAARVAEHLRGRIAPDLLAERVGAVDITLYRDDLSEITAQPVVRQTDIPFPIDGLHVVLIDDVLMTGRSVRAALQSIMDLGRPRRVWLSVLVDRGGREVPIAADHVAWDLTGDPQCPLEAEEKVLVRLTPGSEADGIFVRVPPTPSQQEQR